MSTETFSSSSSISSPSTSDPPSPPLIAKCLICGMPSRGNHFGVLSCRACAAFFRTQCFQTIVRSEERIQVSTEKCGKM
ncbi:hypothetical protein B9Z55_021375 [Caenorhabditis nigoni]|uniref:Nuclear receptor domain-containing protein n=1 Tax=Caenorhabditis nigoni TaxID=1611254 RepID=A0A2G5TRP0_9PELO|nr:hypothetical protein B9Z55_021375 [Caenorhabditis nigoni]